MIKAIPTKYNDILFRSRLEARWAVYFDLMGIEYLYEPEGYNLDGVYYLPDFYLPKVSMFAEVKPFDFSPEEYNKARLLVIHSRMPVLKLIGYPDKRPYFVITSRYIDEEMGYIDEETGFIITNYHDYYRYEGRFFYYAGEPLEDLGFEEDGEAREIIDKVKKYQFSY